MCLTPASLPSSRLSLPFCRPWLPRVTIGFWKQTTIHSPSLSSAPTRNCLSKSSPKQHLKLINYHDQLLSILYLLAFINFLLTYHHYFNIVYCNRSNFSASNSPGSWRESEIPMLQLSPKLMKLSRRLHSTDRSPWITGWSARWGSNRNDNSINFDVQSLFLITLGYHCISLYLKTLNDFRIVNKISFILSIGTFEH